jgi:hypothetical protein
MKTYDKIRRESGSFPVSKEEQNQFDDRMKYLHSRIMGEL